MSTAADSSVVDIHNHFIPPELVNDARKAPVIDGIKIETIDGTDRMIHQQGYNYPLDPVFFDLDRRIAGMDQLGIDHQVVSITPTLFLYWADPASTVDFSRMANDALARFVKEAGGRMTGVATLPMQDPDASCRELRRAVEELELRGAEIAPVIEGTPLDDSSLLPVLETAQHLGVPLILHPTYVGDRPGLEDFYLTNLIGNPLESCVCAARLIFSGVLDRLTGLDLVLMHGGGYLPYQIGRLDHGFRVRTETQGCANPPSRYVRRFTFDTVTHNARALEFLIGLAGTDRVAYGTDYPFDMAAGSLPSQLDGIELGAFEHASVAGGNAARLFGITTTEYSR